MSQGFGQMLYEMILLVHTTLHGRQDLSLLYRRNTEALVLRAHLSTRAVPCPLCCLGGGGGGAGGCCCRPASATAPPASCPGPFAFAEPRVEFAVLLAGSHFCGWRMPLPGWAGGRGGRAGPAALSSSAGRQCASFVCQLQAGRRAAVFLIVRPRLLACT